jgi:hypothetical protein
MTSERLIEMTSETMIDFVGIPSPRVMDESFGPHGKWFGRANGIRNRRRRLQCLSATVYETVACSLASRGLEPTCTESRPFIRVGTANDGFSVAGYSGVDEIFVNTSAFLGTYYGLAFLSVRKCPSFISVYHPLSLQPIESCSKGLENGDHCGRGFRATLNENIFGLELGAFCVENF